MDEKDVITLLVIKLPSSIVYYKIINNIISLG